MRTILKRCVNRRARQLALMVTALWIQAGVGTVLAAGGPVSRNFEVKGVRLHYLDKGRGDPVMLIHGWYSSAEINWRLTGVFDELAKDHRVVALDLPGHGRSDRPEDDKAYGLQVVEDVVALMDHLKLKRAHIVGYSAGGMVAVKLLATHPDRVISGMVGGMGWLRDGSPLQKFWDLIPARPGSRTPAAFARGLGRLAVTEAELKSINLPVKILVGDHDPVKQMYVVPLRRVRKDWPVVEIKDAGHFSCIVKQQFRAEIAEWVRQHTRP